MLQAPARVQPEADQEEVAQLVARYDLLALPVTADEFGDDLAVS